MGEFLDIARTVLLQGEKPMRVREIVEVAREKGYLDFSGGLTPHQTLKARISEDIKKKKEKSDFKRVAKGIFALRNFDRKEYDAIPFEKKITRKEDVLVIETERLKKIGLFNGIKSNGINKYLKVILDKNSTRFVPRLKAEIDFSHKQILSYVIVEKNNFVLRFVRGVYTNAHSMLRGSLCIGFGGHVQSTDLDLFEQLDNDNGFLNSVKRELHEELKIPENCITSNTLKILGILNDDSSDVGKVHIAIILRLNLDKIKLVDVKKLKGEKSINQLTFIPIEKLVDDFEKYEYWSKLCVKEFYKRSSEFYCKIHRVKNYSFTRNPKVIIIVGAIGSGKTEVSKILEEEFGYNFISSGRILQSLMKSSSIDKIGRHKFQDLAFQFISNDGGLELLANKLFELITEGSKQKFVIDGIRNIKTYELLKSKLGSDCALIFVESTPDNCFKFYSKRERLDNFDINIFYEYLNHPVEQDIKVILGKSNLVVYNHGSLSSFKNRIKRFFKSELSKYEKI
jgi:predicted NUDIX family phosphoesterase/dephospho-CoA kinase